MKPSELRFLAAVEQALSITKNVKGMEGFFDFFVKDISIPDRKLIHRWLKAKEDERQSFLRQAKESGWGTEPTEPSSSAPLSDLRASAVNS